ncbi:protein MAIN-LIKE 2-like [Arachis ipaensis]|uniref:protein MAIN-LIKE 2-like n=1 Tax=Arachis ipaensis TaxID=130454 RepID=UPI0007AF734E|nr:protein MAIN-LIKE 2-like [Arachis ipaensis]XP_025684614.1 protein MAIN-LIKE 2-like [Arachis hypogaea]
MEDGRPVWEWFQELFSELLPSDKVKQFTVHFTWFHRRFTVLPVYASKDTVRIYARAYIMMLLSTPLFSDKSVNQVHIQWLPFVARLDDMGTYSWGSTALAWLIDACVRWPTEMSQTWQAPYSYYSLESSSGSPLSGRMDLTTFLFRRHPVPTSDGKEQRIIQFCLALDRLGGQDPYDMLDVLSIVHPKILVEEHGRLWRTDTGLIYFAVNEWHQVDRVVSQLGGVQHGPDTALNIDWLHGKDGRSGDKWFLTYFQTWHLHWDNIVDSILTIQRVADPGQSAKFLDWWYCIAHRFLLPDAAFTDPRVEEIPNNAFHRGSS